MLPFRIPPNVTILGASAGDLLENIHSGSDVTGRMHGSTFQFHVTALSRFSRKSRGIGHTAKVTRISPGGLLLVYSLPNQSIVDQSYWNCRKVVWVTGLGRRWNDPWYWELV